MEKLYRIYNTNTKEFMDNSGDLLVDVSTGNVYVGDLSRNNKTINITSYTEINQYLGKDSLNQSVYVGDIVDVSAETYPSIRKEMYSHEDWFEANINGESVIKVGNVYGIKE